MINVFILLIPSNLTVDKNDFPEHYVDYYMS